MSNVRDSACQRNLLFEPSSILGDWGIFFSKLVDGHFDMELVRIWIGVGIFLEFINHFGSVFEVSCGVQDLLFFRLFIFCLIILGLLSFFGCFFSFFGLHSFLLLQSFLLVFAELLFLLTFFFWYFLLLWLFLFFQGLDWLDGFVSLHSCWIKEILFGPKKQIYL